MINIISLTLDLAIVLISIITIAVVISRGFIKTILDLTSVIFAIFFAKFFASTVSSVFYNFFYKSFSDSLKKIIDNLISKNELPVVLDQDNILGILKKYNINLANTIISENIDNGIQVIVESVIGLLSYAIAFLLIFILTIVAFKILSIVLLSNFAISFSPFVSSN